MKKILLITLLTLSLTTMAYADDYGHEGVSDEEPTIEEMMVYALEDEVLAYTSYSEIVKAFDITKPFTNIMRAELNHIEMVKELMLSYDFEIPEVDPSSHLILPETLDAAFKAGVQAEIDNIALYETFLENNDVPDDVRSVFEYLIAGSEKHLSAFERQVERDSPFISSGARNTFGKGNSTIRGNRNKQ